MNKEQIFDALPLSERTLQKRMRRNVLPVPFRESDYPCEYIFEVGEQTCMVKYYRGRKLAAYTLTFEEE